MDRDVHKTQHQPEQREDRKPALGGQQRVVHLDQGEGTQRDTQQTRHALPKVGGCTVG